jgi:2-(3-amino-3-carboxypropyl)histidine synthase
MKLTFVDVKYKEMITLPEEFLSQLPKKVMLFLNIQLHHQYEPIKKQLEAKGIEVVTSRPKHSWHDGQLLGCGIEKWELGQEAFVYVGDGFFHPSALLFNNTESVYQYDPKTEKIKILTKDDLQQVLRAKKGGLATFYTSKNIGVIITTKYGQQRMQPAFKLEEKFPDKTFYYLLGDTIDFSKLEDFPFIQCYINTACPRISDDHSKMPRPCINIEDIAELKMRW